MVTTSTSTCCCQVVAKLAEPEAAGVVSRSVQRGRGRTSDVRRRPVPDELEGVERPHEQLTDQRVVGTPARHHLGHRESTSAWQSVREHGECHLLESGA